MAKSESAVENWKSNMEATKKNKFFRDWEQLKFQSKNGERELLSQLQMKGGENKKFHMELDGVESSLNKELKSERLKIQQHLYKMKNKVNTFQLELEDVHATPEFVSRLKEAMEGIESTITSFKEQQRKMFESLLSDQAGAERDIEIINSRLETMSHAGSVGNDHSKPRPFKHTNSSNLPDEVKAFEKYVGQFGQQGGWDEYDHGTFLKVRNKFKGKPSFVSAAVASLPGRDELDVKDHENWYSHYLQLQTKKKAAIAEWKLKKEQEAKISSATEIAEEETSKQEALRKEREKQEELERQARKKELGEWKVKKAEKAQRLAEEKKLEKLKAERAKEREDLMLRDVREQARLRLKEKKDEKERERWRRDSEQEHMRSARSEQALQEIARFQTRDQEVLEYKKRERSKKEEEQKLKEERLARSKREVQVTALADRNRLYRPTDAWIQRQKQKDKDGSPKDPVMHNMPHRAVPTWRQGV